MNYISDRSKIMGYARELNIRYVKGYSMGKLRFKRLRWSAEPL